MLQLPILIDKSLSTQIKTITSNEQFINYIHFDSTSSLSISLSSSQDTQNLVGTNRNMKRRFLIRLVLFCEVHNVGKIIFRNESGNLVGELEISYGCMFQPYYLELQQPDVEAFLYRGLFLSIDGPMDLQLTLDSSLKKFNFSLIILDAVDLSESGIEKLKLFRDCFWSFHSLQPFNWLEGCVLDGMIQLIQSQTSEENSNLKNIFSDHLKWFSNNEGRLTYFGPINQIITNAIFGMEACLPFGPLVQIEPDHQFIQIFDHYVSSHLNNEGFLFDSGSDAEGRKLTDTATTIEGCYTVAYPLAIRKTSFKGFSTTYLAIQNLLVRIRELVIDGWVYQRKWSRKKPEQRAWARATAWYLLGVLRTLDAFSVNDFNTYRDEITFITSKTREVADRCLFWVLPNGGWNCYLDDEDSGYESSGSAGIAAGLVGLYRIGILEHSKIPKVGKETLKSLLKRVNFDGFLGEVAQLNRGGDEFQRNGFRVYGQFAQGLMAQLIAELKKIQIDTSF